MGNVGSGRKPHIQVTADASDKQLMKYEFTPKQEFLLEEIRREVWHEVLFGGAKGGAKTGAIIRAFAMAAAYWYPGEDFLLMRYGFTQLKDYLWKELCDVVPRDMLASEPTKSGPSLKMPFKNGSRIIGTHGKNKEVFMGPSFRWIGGDEAHELPQEVLRMFWGRFRHTIGKAKHHMVLLAANPHPGYLEENFYSHKDMTILENGVRYREEIDENSGIAHNVLFIPSKVDDNTFLDDVEDFKAQQKRVYTEYEYERFVEGSWAELQGLVYSEYDRNVHVAEIEFDRDEAYNHIQALDWGIVAATVLLFGAMDSTGHIYIYDELSYMGTTPREVYWDYAKKCDEYELERGAVSGRRQLVVGDYGMKTRQDVEKEPTWYEFQRLGMALVNASKNPTKGVFGLKRMFQDHRITISPKCERLIWELRRFQFKRPTERQTIHGPLPVGFKDVDNDGCDAMNYMYRYLTSPEVKPADFNSEHSPAPIVQQFLNAEDSTTYAEYGCGVNF